MKRFRLPHIVLSVLVTLVLYGCGLIPTTMQIERGMTKADVERLFGRPSHRRFNANQEEWEYRRHYDDGGARVVVVTFVNGQVDKLDDYTEPAPPVKPILPESYPRTGVIVGRGSQHYPPTRAEQERWFEQFFARVRKVPFDDDRNRLIGAAAQTYFFTSAQVCRLLSLKTFGDDRLKMLSLVARRVVDMEHAYRIIDMFTFDSEKREAANLLGLR